MRLFVALALDAATAAALVRLQQRMTAASEGLRWMRPEDQHVTLQFLGEVSPERAACVTGALAAVRSAQVRVRIAGLGFFQRAGVFWAGVEPTAELLELQQRVTASTRACGFVAEPRPYRPHITLARSSGRRGTGALAALQQAVERKAVRIAADFVASEFALYESLPTAEGARYEVRGRFALNTE